MNIKRKFFLVILAIIVLGGLLVTGCTKGIARGWAGGAVTPNGKMFVASMTGRIIAIDASTNAVLGTPAQLVTTASGGLSCLPSSCSGQSSAGVVIYASPEVSGQIVYVGGTDGKVYGYQFVDNSLLKDPEWVYPRQGTMSGYIIGGIVVANDSVYFATSDGVVYALNANGLYLEWSKKIDNKIWSAPIVDGDTLYIGSFGKTVYALNTTDGSEKWTYKTDGAISSTPVVDGNNIYIGDYDRYFYALDKATGNLVWKFPPPNEVTDTPRNWFWAQPAVLNGVIYAPCLDGDVYALDAANGNLVNKYVLGNSISSSPVVIGDSIVVATSVASTDPKKQINNKVYIIDPTDKSRREVDLPDYEDVNAPLFNYGSIVYIHTSKDNLYWIDTAAQDVKLSPNPINLTTVK